MADDVNHVNVMLRVRPLLLSEAERGEVANATVLPDNKSVMITSQMSQNRKVEAQQHNFDFCFGPSAPQEQVFEESGVKQMIHSALEGIASTILCFGQTGSGKTYTLNGPSFDVVSDHAGIQYRAVQYVAALVQQCNAHPGLAPGFKPITLRASYMEIYQENINDLLNDTQHLKCRWSKPAEAFFVENLMIVECLNSDDLVAVLQEGNSNRKRASHNLNVDSSRSHVIFTMYFERRDTPDMPPKLGRIHFVDLAGSEKLKDSESSGLHEEETKAINKSLFALGNVIQSLSKAGGRRCTVTASGTTASIVPYRDSTLTKLLMDSLGGSCKTLMVACISPSNRFTEESIRTIQYAQRTKNIVNAKPIVRMNAKQQSVYQLKVEVEMLRKENVALRQIMAQSGVQFSPSALEAVMASINPGMLGTASSAAAAQQALATAVAPPQHAGTPGSFYRAAQQQQQHVPQPSSAPLPPHSHGGALQHAAVYGHPAAKPHGKGGMPVALPPMAGGPGPMARYPGPASPLFPSPPTGGSPTLPAAHETAALMLAAKAAKDNEGLRDEVSQLRHLILSLRSDMSAGGKVAPAQQQSPLVPMPVSASSAGGLPSQSVSQSLLPKRVGDRRGSGVASSQEGVIGGGQQDAPLDLPPPPAVQAASAPPVLQTTSSLTDFGFRPAPKKAQRLQWGPSQDTTMNSQA